MLGSEYQVEVLWVDTGIVTIPLFKIDVLLSSKCFRFGSEFSGMEMDDEVESERNSDHRACQHMRILVVEKYWKFW